MSYTYDIARDEEGNTNVTVFVDGRLFHADQNHPNFQDITEALIDFNEVGYDEQDIIDLFDVSFTIGQMFERLSDRVLVSGGAVFFDGEEIHDTLTETILRFRTEGQDFTPLVNFFEKIQTNPNPHSREHLYRWLQLHSYSITSDGDFIAYKGITNDYKSLTGGGALVNGVWETGQITNTPGSIVEMPRSKVEFDPARGCSVGLHVATFEFARGFSSGYVVTVKVNPRDVVSVPTDSGDAKMRVCRYVVLEEVEGPRTSIYVDMDGYTDDDEYDDEYDNEGTEQSETGGFPATTAEVTTPEPDPDRTLSARLRRAFGRRTQ